PRAVGQGPGQGVGQGALDRLRAMSNTTFAGHPARTARVTTGILGQLNREWAALSLRDHRSAVRGWAALHPVLAPCRSLSDVVRLVQDRAGENDLELAALIALTQDGDPLA